MKKLIFFVLICFNLSASAQVFVKTLFYLFPATSSIASVSFGMEIKHKHLGYEYMINSFSAGGDGPSFRSTTMQFSIKYYFFSPDSSRFKFYTAAIVNYKDMRFSDELALTADGSNIIFAKGIGYGILLGNNLDFGRHFGLDSGISLYYLSTDNNYQFKSYYLSQLCSKFHLGVKFLFYIRI
jgi:hypothetical protein